MVKDFVHQSNYDHSWSSCIRAYFLRYPNPSATHVLSADVIDRRIEYRPVRGSPYTTASSSAVTLSDLEPQETIPVLCTTRLILKKGNLPKWAPSGLIKNAESWVMEESEVELDLFPPRTSSNQSRSIEKSLMGRTKNGRAMRSWTRNLDHTTVLAITEGLVFKERFGFVSADGERAAEDEANVKGKARADSNTNYVWKSYCKTLTTAQIESQVSFGMLRRRIEKFGLARFVAHKDTSQQGMLWTRSQLEEGASSKALSPPTREDQLQRSSMPQKRIKLLESLRPPFLDGYPLGPWQKLKVWWYSGHYSQVKVLQDGYPIEREDEEYDDDDDQVQDRKANIHQGQEQMRFRGAEQEGPWAELSGKSGKGAVYSDQERNAEEGVVNQVRKRLGLPPQLGVERKEKGAVKQAVERVKSKVFSLLGFDDDNLSAKQETKGRLELIDRERTV